MKDKKQLPFLMRFATPLHDQASPSPEHREMPTKQSFRGESRFTRVNNETTDDE